jgi:hypothetical protein
MTETAREGKLTNHSLEGRNKCRITICQEIGVLMGAANLDQVVNQAEESDNSGTTQTCISKHPMDLLRCQIFTDTE